MSRIRIAEEAIAKVVRETAPAPPGIDPLLWRLIMLPKSVHPEVVLLVDGVVVTGTVISEAEYLELQASARELDKSTDPPRILSVRSIEYFFKVAQQTLQTTETRTDHRQVHLRDVVIGLGENAKPVRLFRVPLASIRGWEAVR